MTRFDSRTTLLTMLWLAALGAALWAMIQYSQTPGQGGVAPRSWPAESEIPLDGSQPTLIVFLHPRCPCSMATLGELELLVTRHPDRFRVYAVVIRPAGTPEDWTQTSLWQRVSAMPGVAVRIDNEEKEATLFQAKTSGETVLYAPTGRLVFQGGITLARAHSGDNPGRDALVDYLENRVMISAATPAFGCPLSDRNSD